MQTPKKEAEPPPNPRSIGRPKHRNIIRWTDEKLIIAFAELRRSCSTRRIDIRAALDDAAHAIASFCTGDALSQQLIKRSRHIQEDWNHGVLSSGRAYTPRPQRVTGVNLLQDSSSPTTAGCDTFQPITPRTWGRGSAKKKNIKKDETTTNTPHTPQTPVSVKKEYFNKDTSPYTPPASKYESDSEYTESPEKGKNKRTRQSAKKATGKNTVKKSMQLQDIYDKEEHMDQTPSKKLAKTTKHSLNKDDPASTDKIKLEARSARKSIARTESVKRQSSFVDDDEDEADGEDTYYGVKNPDKAIAAFQTENPDAKLPPKLAIAQDRLARGSLSDAEMARKAANKDNYIRQIQANSTKSSDSSHFETSGLATPFSGNSFNISPFDSTSFPSNSFSDDSIGHNSFNGSPFSSDPFSSFNIPKSMGMPMLTGMSYAPISNPTISPVELLAHRTAHAAAQAAYDNTIRLAGSNGGTFPRDHMFGAIPGTGMMGDHAEIHRPHYQARNDSFASDRSAATNSSNQTIPLSVGHHDKAPSIPYQTRTNSFPSDIAFATSSSGQNMPFPRGHPSLFANDHGEYLDDNEGFGGVGNGGFDAALFGANDDTPRRGQLSNDMADMLHF